MTRHYVPFDDIMDRPLSLNDDMQGRRKNGQTSGKRQPRMQPRNGISTQRTLKNVNYDDTDPSEHDTPVFESRPAVRAKRRHSNKSTAARPHILTSAEHTNVSCRFIIRQSSDLTPKRIDVNTPIPSNKVVRIVSPVQECPICLERAEVPRMLGCGHVMCLPCMIKHRRYSSQASVCPICGELVSLGGSRTTPVTFLESDERFLPHEGGEVVLTLMFKPKESCIAMPVNVVPESAISDTHFPGPDMTLWSRICEGSVDYAKQELAREVKILIGARKKAMEEYGDDEGYSEAASDIKQLIHSMQDETEPRPTGKKKRTHSHGKQGGKPEGMYFYQAGFESPVVFTLSQLDVSMLKAAFGSFSEFPTSLITTVENIHYTSSDQSSDKRQKFLAHLPDQTPLAFMECDWTGILPPHVLEKFQSKINDRRSKKVSKEVREEEERQKAQEAIDLQFRSEIAEAMVPHEGVGFTEAAGLDMSLLPALPTAQNHPPGSQTAQPPPAKPQPRWVDPRRDYDELMRNAYVPERGRKNIYLRL